MSFSNSISSHIPYLRRFARALTGSQAGGDAYVVATLEAILADPTKFKPDDASRVALYRLFLTIWSSMPINGEVDVPIDGDEAAANRNLNAITLRPRIAFLLTSVEGFDNQDVARTLECSLDDVRSLLAQAGREIAEQIRTDVQIIEDEPFIALDLQALVEQLGHRVSGIARTHADAVEAVKKHRPGLILADIQLADGSSGLDAVNEILAAYQLPVIFITAYPERFLTGESPEPAFLIAKPFNVDAVKAVISQALFFDRKSHPWPGGAAAKTTARGDVYR